MERAQVEQVFAQARSELYFPPCSLHIASREEGRKAPSPFYVLGSTVYVYPETIPKSCDPKEFLLSVMRHELSHIHYCPYDIRTAHGLLKRSYDTTKDWDLAFFSLLLFTDLTVDCVYLRRRLRDTPYHVKVELRKKRTGPMRLVQAAYEFALPDMRLHRHPTHLELAAMDIKTVMSSGKDWYSKISMISKIVLRLRQVYGMRFRLKLPQIPLGAPSIPLREDLSRDPISELSDLYGGIKEEQEAKAFHKYWLEPRLGKGERQKLEKAAKRLLSSASERRRKRPLSIRRGTGTRGSGKKAVTPELYQGEEPSLPTELSKPYGNLPDMALKEAMWRVFWYRSRAQRVLIRYLEEGRRPEPKLAISRYPDDWTAEDDVEDLDVEASLDEGPLMAEVNMLKWVEEARGQGHSFVIRRAPSILIVLDASRSMQEIADEASTSAMVAYLGARRAGGLTSSVTFSTNFISKGWEEDEIEKQLALSTFIGEFTILPVHEISRMVQESQNPAIITLITDCGWQNLEEVMPELEYLISRGNYLTVFYLKGGDYPEKLSKIAALRGAKVIEVKNPERDLEELVVSETVRLFGKYMDLKTNRENLVPL
ncbi:MAG: hypothetical protein QXF26_04230 [Candidatus Bathyarchaeia archaeon]